MNGTECLAKDKRWARAAWAENAEALLVKTGAAPPCFITDMQGFPLADLKLPQKDKMWFVLNVAQSRDMIEVGIQGKDSEGAYRLVSVTVDRRLATCGLIASFALRELSVDPVGVSLADDTGRIYDPKQTLLEAAGWETTSTTFCFVVRSYPVPNCGT